MTQRITNSQYPNIQAVWDEIYKRSQLGDRYVANNVAAATWDDLRAPAAGINPPGAASDPDIDQLTGHALFADNGTEALAVFFQMPHIWVEGSQLRPHIHWIKEGAGDVLWQLDYKWYNAGDEWPSAYTTIQTTSVSTEYGEVSPAVDVGTISAFPAISGSGKRISSMLECRFGRIGGDAADTYTGDARMVEMDIHYLRLGGWGSEAEYSRIHGEADVVGA